MTLEVRMRKCKPHKMARLGVEFALCKSTGEISSCVLRCASSSATADGLSSKSALGSGIAPAQLVAVDAFIQGTHPKQSPLAVGGRGSGASGSRDAGNAPGRQLAVADGQRKRKHDAPTLPLAKAQKTTKDAEGVLDSLTTTLASLQERGFASDNNRTLKGAADLCQQVRDQLDELKEMCLQEDNEEAENEDSTV